MTTDNPFTLTFTLKQHTPIIHFQHEQAGATLRATEVKPKLDKFLIVKKGGWENVPSNWKISSKNQNHKPLDYKVKITTNGEAWTDFIEQPKTDDYGSFIQKWNDKEKKYSTATYPYPLYFGNMGEDYYETGKIKKFEFHTNPICITITSFAPNLISFIQECFPEFIATHNFGSRQGKGFGSFYCSDKEKFPINEKWFDYRTEISFNIDPIRDNQTREGQIFKKLFERLDWFYRSLRGGINRKKPKKIRKNGRLETVKDSNGIDVYEDKFYFKSLLFLYFKAKKIQWEKKTIKESFFKNDGRRRNGSYLYYGLDTQAQAQPDSDLLNYPSQNKKLVKTLLGLSSVESWKSYGKTIEKENIRVSDDDKIQRYKSPILFKIIELSSGRYAVFLKFEDDIKVLGKWFQISGGGTPFPLQIPDNFSLHDFFSFICNKACFQITSHVENRNGFHNQLEFGALKNMFQNLKCINHK